MIVAHSVKTSTVNGYMCVCGERRRSTDRIATQEAARRAIRTVLGQLSTRRATGSAING